MPVDTSKVKFYKSSNPNSDGGTISSNEITSGSLNNLFPDIGSGQVIYRKFFVKNTDDTYTMNSVILFFSSTFTSNQVSIEMALGTASDTTPPETWYSPYSLDNGISAGSIAPGGSIGVWLKLSALGYTKAVNNENINIGVDYI